MLPSSRHGVRLPSPSADNVETSAFHNVTNDSGESDTDSQNYSYVSDSDSQDSSAEFEHPIHPDGADRPLRSGGTPAPRSTLTRVCPQRQHGALRKLARNV